MVADFRQFYGIDLPIEDDAEFEDLPRAALLWGALPRESRTARRLDPDLIWSDGEYLLRSIEHAAQVLVWQRTKDGQKGRRQPKPLQSPGERAKARERADRALANKKAVADALGIAEEDV